MKAKSILFIVFTLGLGCASDSSIAWYSLSQLDLVKSQDFTLKEVNEIGPIEFSFSGSLASYVDCMNAYLMDQAHSSVRVELDHSLAKSFAPYDIFKDEKKQVDLSFTDAYPQDVFGQSAAKFDHRAVYVYGYVIFVPETLFGLYRNANRRITRDMLADKGGDPMVSAGLVISIFNFLIPDDSLVIKSGVLKLDALERLRNLKLNTGFVCSSDLLGIIREICKEARVSAVMESPNTLVFVDQD